MQYFGTPQQNLVNYDPQVRREFTAVCPHCQTSFAAVGSFRHRRQGGFKCRHCKGIYANPVSIVANETPQKQTPEEWVMDRIGEQYDKAYWGLRMRYPRPGGFQNVLGAVAQVGMFSDNSQFARESMVITAQQRISQFQHHQDAVREAHAIEAEYEYALALTDEYFHGAERRAQETAALGTAIADAMYLRVQQQRAT